MNTIAKIIVTTGLAFGALSAQAATGVHDTYPGDFPTPSASAPRTPYVGPTVYPNLYQQGWAVEAEAAQSAVRSKAEVRAEIPKQRALDVYSVGA